MDALIHYCVLSKRGAEGDFRKHLCSSFYYSPRRCRSSASSSATRDSAVRRAVLLFAGASLSNQTTVPLFFLTQKPAIRNRIPEP